MLTTDLSLPTIAMSYTPLTPNAYFRHWYQIFKSPIMESREKKLTLLLLCWLLGIFVIHRFYTGKYFTASLQLLLLALAVVIVTLEVKILWPLGIFAASLFLLWWVIDFVRIIMGKFTDREGNRITEWV
jgi:TM2 domain-containing membrane protein YozV